MNNPSDSTATIDALVQSEYQHGFVTDIESDQIPPGLNEDVVRVISAKKNEPEFMTEWRLQAYRKWQEMALPDWAKLNIAPIEFEDICYYSAPKSMADGPKSLEEVDPELLRTYEKLGIPLHEQMMLA
ncbi:MAG: Fe-S cluster assembly protein SufB, partial [Spongiibacteraceae bacterium]